jgi:hypothetical protein
MEQGLELVPAVGAHRVDAERELLDDVIGKGDRILLRVAG